ncbi:MAG: PaaI family thioesterase [Xanthomonadales bacterium]|nr:PaaI family thioesterase [Xanthomonadales bacterium]
MDDDRRDDTHTADLHGHAVQVRGFDEAALVEGMARTTVPFNELVGLRFTLVSPDRVEATLQVRPEHHQPSGVVHGGVYATLVEAVGSTGSVAHVAAEGKLAMGVHNATSFLRPTTEGVLTAVATPIHLGRTQHLWDVRVTRADGSLTAKGELRVAVVEPRTP